MKHILVMIFSMILLAAGASMSHAQTALPVCNEGSAITWQMNSEEDMDKYNVYASNAPIDLSVDNVTLRLLEVAHDPTAAIDDGQGNKILKTSVMSTLSEGDKYFRVSAVDQVGNESGLSKEVSCHYNTKPGTPTGVTIVLKFKK